MGADPDPAARIQRLRTRLGLSQEQLARQLGVSFATVNRWESGGAGTHSVTVPAGTYQASVVDETIAERVLGHPVSIVVRTWLAPGVGPVQSEVLDKAALGGGPEVREVLKSFTK